LRQAIDDKTWPWITRVAALEIASTDHHEVYESIGTIARNRREAVRLLRHLGRDGIAALRNPYLAKVYDEQILSRLTEICDEHEHGTQNESGPVPEPVVRKVMERLGFRMITSPQMLLADDTAWEMEVRRPVVFLASRVLPLLSKFSGGISMLFVSIWSLGLAMLPLVAATHNMIPLLLVAYFPSPLLVLGPLAVVGTSCDDMLTDLNELRRHKLNVEQMCRIDNLRCYLQDQNRGQGLGFEICGVVMDKRKLVRISGVVSSVLTSATVSLMQFGELQAMDGGSTACTC
jgi:hypothetical protein